GGAALPAEERDARLRRGGGQGADRLRQRASPGRQGEGGVRGRFGGLVPADDPEDRSAQGGGERDRRGHPPAGRRPPAGGHRGPAPDPGGGAGPVRPGVRGRRGGGPQDRRSAAPVAGRG